MAQSLEVFELPLGCLLSLLVCLVKDLAGGHFGGLADVGRDGEPALGQLADKVDVGRREGADLQRLLLALVVGLDLAAILQQVQVDVLLGL